MVDANNGADPREALEALEIIDPAPLTQSEWLDAFMGARAAGIPYEDVDAWNRRDPERYDEGANRRRWQSIDPEQPGGKTPRTLFRMAYDRGWKGGQRGTTARASRRGLRSVETSRRTGTPLPVLPDVGTGKLPNIEAARKVPADEQLQRYLRALHDPAASVVVVTGSTPGKNGKARPNGSGRLYKVGDVIGHPEDVLSTADPKAGAWVTLNEFDPGQFEKDGRREAALSSFRYALIEADEDEDGSPMPLDEQLRHAARLRLPARAGVWSGAKSLHLVCAVDAKDAAEFRERAEFLTSFCLADGFNVDTGVRDPGRLSRLPGVTRNGEQQTLLWAAGEDGSGDCWAASWNEWRAWAAEHDAGADEPARGERRHDNGTRVPVHRRMADTLLDEFGACLINGTPAVRDGQTYRHEGGWASWDRALVLAYPSSRTRDRNEAINLAKCECPRVEQAPPEYVAFRNGVLDIESGKLDTQGVYSIMNVIPHDWNPEAVSSGVDQALEAWADGDEQTLARLEECAGQCLDRSSELQFFWVLVGEGGNGKSLFTKTIGNAIGAANYSAVQPDELDKRFQGLSIAGKLACLADDASSQSMTAGMVGTLKRFTGGATVRSDVKGRDAIEFVPYATIVVSFNRFPRVTGCDGGFMRRVQPILFSRTFKPGADGLKAARELKGEAAAERLLVRAVEGLRRLRENGEPTPSSRARRVVDEIRIENDSFEAWRIDQGITADSLDQRRQSDVLAEYRDWCEREHEDPLSSRRFYSRVKSEWQVKTNTKRGDHGKPAKFYEVP